MHTDIKYLSYVEKPISFRKGISHQAERLAMAIENKDYSLYESVVIR